MRDRRVTEDALKEDEDRRATRRWVAVIIAICTLWLVGMVVASVVGYEHKNPVRIENWRPDTGGR